MDWDYDVVVVGSGFGGSVSALRLVEKGYSVAILEAGRRFEDKDFPKTNWNIQKSVFAPHFGLRGILRYTLLPHVMIFSGAGVGGGSLVYANTLYTPPDKFFQANSWSGIQDWKAALQPHYATGERMLGVTESPFYGPAERMLEECGKEMGQHAEFRRTPVGIYFGKPGESVPDPYFGGEGPERTGCTLCGGCMVGCRVGAKNTLVKNYLYFAEKYGARVFPNRMAIDVKALAGGGYEVTHQASGAWVRKDQQKLRARKVVLSAGVMGTLKLLWASKLRGSLPEVSERLGLEVRTNSESLLGVSAYGKDIDHSRGIAIAGSIYPDEDTHIEVVRYSKGSDLNSFLTAYLTDGGPGLPRQLRFLGTVLRHPVDSLRALWPFGWADRSIILLVMQTVDNSIRIEPGWTPGSGTRLTSKLEKGKEIPAYIPIGNEVARRMAKKMNGFPQSTLPEVFFNIPMTAHILGGAGIGANRHEGVISAENEVFGHSGLYVCDGSMVPANLGVNPSLTITALTEHAMDQMPPKGGNFSRAKTAPFVPTQKEPQA